MPIYNLIYNLQAEKNATYLLGEIDTPFELRVGDNCVVSDKIMGKIRDIEPCINLPSRFRVKEVIYNLTQNDEHNIPIDIIIEAVSNRVLRWPNTLQQWLRFAIGLCGVVIILIYNIGIIEFNTMVSIGSLIAFMGYVVDGLFKNIEERKTRTLTLTN